MPDLEEGGGFPLEGPPDRSVSRAKGGRMTLHQRDIKEQKHVSPSEHLLVTASESCSE